MKNLLIAVLCFGALTPVYAKSCKDFKTQKEAQTFYESKKKAGGTGWKGLDRDGDGKACDCLPGGSGKNCPKAKK